MAALVTLVAGTTGPFYFQLLDQGEPINLTDFAVTLTLSGTDYVSISTTGKIAIISESDGIVSYTPGASDITVALSPFKTRWTLTEDTGAVDYIPTSYRDEWDAVPV